MQLDLALKMNMTPCADGSSVAILGYLDDPSASAQAPRFRGAL
jgi:hypothetical protein